MNGSFIQSLLNNRQLLVQDNQNIYAVPYTVAYTIIIVDLCYKQWTAKRS